MQHETPAQPVCSIIIPNKDEGERLRQCLTSIFRQKTSFGFEVIIVDSGSGSETLEIIKQFSVRLHCIPPAAFNHGLTRDLGASLANGEYLVFLNGDAIPCDEKWLASLVEPLILSDHYAAVQGGNREIEGGTKFFWDSCGARFYFTRLSEQWIARHDGIGFSTVNAAMRKRVWRELPFGEAPIMEDKQWQKLATAKGHRILLRSDAAVFHSHDFDLKGVIKRCQNEGFGWGRIGQRYRLRDAIYDFFSPGKYVQLAKGIWRGKVRKPSEVLYPFLRPIFELKGNRINRTYR
jgi:rhamnosyltransferase